MKPEKFLKTFVFPALFASVILGFAVSVSASVKEKNASVWEPKTKTVSVFKNGIGFFIREGEVSLNPDGWCYGNVVPPASFGTFGIMSDGNWNVDRLAVGPGEIFDFTEEPFLNAPEKCLARLRELKNLSLQLTFRKDSTEQIVSGRLTDVSESYAVLECGAVSQAVALTDIQKIQLLDLPLRVHAAPNQNAQKSNNVKSVPQPEAAQPSVPERIPLAMGYLRKGITWIPEYWLSPLPDGKHAQLTLRATLINEAEDLTDATVLLVFGVPHFLHSEIQSPLVAGQVVRSLAVSSGMGGNSAIPSHIMTQSLSNVAMNAAPEIPRNLRNLPSGTVTERALGESGDVRPMMEGISPQETLGAADLGSWKQEHVNLRCGERAMLHLFSVDVPISHLFRWSIPGKMEHFLILKNDTNWNWTTGSCIAVSDGRPIAQDVLKYVPAGSPGQLVLTESINFGQSHEKEEVSRETKPLNGTTFNLVQLKGTIRVKNFESKEAEIEILCPVDGKALTASDDGKITLNAEDLRLTERKSQIQWRVKLGAGETKELTYTYERYVIAR